jgi:hypothetical protein
MYKPKLLILSAVLPFPRRSGQQQRVYYTLKAVRDFFHVTFISFTKNDKLQEIRRKLLPMCDDVILLPSRYSRSNYTRLCHKLAGGLYSFGTGLKFSNYVIDRLEFTPTRIASLVESKDFDCALYEYWHAVRSVSAFRQKGIPCVLDMHDILWRSFLEQMKDRKNYPGWWKRWAVKNYRSREEQAWKEFDGIIAINAEEKKYVRSVVPADTSLFYAPMGTDLNLWSYSWEPFDPPRIAYYGGLGNTHRQKDAMRCYESQSYGW